MADFIRARYVPVVADFSVPVRELRKLATAYGIKGVRKLKAADLRAALRDALQATNEAKRAAWEEEQDKLQADWREQQIREYKLSQVIESTTWFHPCGIPVLVNGFGQGIMHQRLFARLDEKAREDKRKNVPL